MGHVMGKISEPWQHCTGSVRQILVNRKRRRSSVSNAGSEEQLELQSPKKKKLLTTSQYIYRALFQEEKDSDITVYALNRIWKLHKVYLEQSPYFYSMFNGSWCEAAEKYVHIQIPDERITEEALDRVFGGLYRDEIEIDHTDVLPILAAATLFQLDGIIDECSKVMIENIRPETAVLYYEAAWEYGCLAVKKATFAWLEINLLSVYSKNHKELRHISIELMTALIASANLYVMQTEFSLYALLRNWIYVRLHADYDFTQVPAIQTEAAPNLSATQNVEITSRAQEQLACLSTAQQQQQQQQLRKKNNNNDVCISDAVPQQLVLQYFEERANKANAFLHTEDGREYMKVFLALRTQFLVNHAMDLQIITNDHIIPTEWLNKHCFHHWSAALRLDHMTESGVKNLPDEVFLKHAMRCGRVLLQPGYQKWRWTGFNYGIDLILIADSRLLSIRRHHRNEHERLLSLQTKRDFMIRVSVSSINQQRQVTFTQTTPILNLTLEKNEESTLMLMDHKLVHPLLISVNLLVMPPEADFKQRLQENEELTNSSNNSIPISNIGDYVDLNKTMETTVSSKEATPRVSIRTHLANKIVNNVSDRRASTENNDISSQAGFGFV